MKASVKIREGIIEKLIFLCAAVSTFAVALITIFVFSSGFPVLKDYGPIRFILGTDWSPTSGAYGILPLIAGTLEVTAGALLVGTLCLGNVEEDIQKDANSSWARVT